MDTNEVDVEVTQNKEKKNKKKYIFPLILLIIIIIILMFYYLVNNKRKSNLEASVIGSSKEQVLTKVFSYKTTGSNSNALQGSTGYDNKIYFSTSKSGPANQKKYYSSIKSYDLSTKKIPELSSFDQVLNGNSTYKINDATTNADAGRNYYVSYDATNGKNSKIIFSTNNIVREADVDGKITNIAYNSSNKKYYSLSSNKLYKFEIPQIEKSNTSKNVGTIKLSKACNISRKSNIVSQGITMKGYLLFFAYHKHPKTNVYANYIDVYDTRNCKSGATISPTQTLYLGSCNSNSDVDNCELESLFYMNSKLYLGYNNSEFRGVNFYRLNVTNESLNTSVKVKNVKDGKVVLQGTAKSDKNKIYSYKFCTNKSGSGCSYKSYKNSVKKYLTEKKISVSYTINDNNKDWYFFAKDIFGNVDVAKIDKKDIQKALK